MLIFYIGLGHFCKSMVDTSALEYDSMTSCIFPRTNPE